MPAAVASILQLPCSSGGGWQDALLDCVRGCSAFELLVAYPGPQPGARIELGGVAFADIGPLEPSSRLARIASRWRSNAPGGSNLEECVRVAADWGADLVHVHGTESGLARVSERLDIPVLISLQGFLTVLEALGRDDYMVPVSAARWLPMYLRGLTSSHVARRVRLAAESERAALAGCRYTAGRTVFDERVSLVLAPNAAYVRLGEVLRDPFYGPRWVGHSERPGGPRLSLCAKSYHRKGVDVAVESIGILAGAGLDVRLRIFGLDPRGERAARLLSRARREGTADRIELLGELTAEQVVAEMLMCDVYLHPSRSDNSPNSLCEAMLLGVPCIASTAGGIPSLATDNVDALLVPPGDAYSLAGAVKSLFSDSSTASRLSEAARQRARVRHDPAVVRDELIQAYTSVVESQRAETVGARK